MCVFLKVLLLGALLAVIPDPTHGAYAMCATSGVCIPMHIAICYPAVHQIYICPLLQRCCLDNGALYGK